MKTRMIPKLNSVRKDYSKGKDKKTGRFVKGNPGGGAINSHSEIVDLCRQASPKALNKLIAIMNSNKSANKDKIMCAKIILERAYGKPKQVDVESGDAAPQLPNVVVQMTNKEYTKMQKEIAENKKDDVDKELL
jgi:hypothetical protein